MNESPLQINILATQWGEREKKNVSRIKLFNIYIGNAEISFYCTMTHLLLESSKGF